MHLDLRPCTAAQLPLVQPWFDDPETQRWLGGPGWPQMSIALVDAPLSEYRGARETKRDRFVAWDGECPVGYIDCGTYDRWATWEGGTGGRGVIAVIEVPSAAIAYVVDPMLRRRGYGVEMIHALTGMPELEHVGLFGAGVEPQNTASIQCLRSAGFSPLDSVPDWEGMVYYVRAKILRPAV
jgi:RimJ/RimL family protein N-acetyltransferase